MIDTLETRVEQDSMGEMSIPKDALYGLQTARSMKYFNIGDRTIPLELIYSYALLKKMCALTNAELEIIPEDIAQAIAKACDEIIDKKHNNQFTLKPWQTGSGTQTNMNLNEVIANRATQILGGEIGSKLVHPNDHVNAAQSTNDTFPTAMHIATVNEINTKLIPALNALVHTIDVKSQEFMNIVKIGRTHLQMQLLYLLAKNFQGTAQSSPETLLELSFT